jgi:thiamine pyrophosphokinase
MHVLIFANGDHDTVPNQQLLIEQADFVIAADGGANHCQQLGIIPDVLLGDLDSVSRQVLKKLSSCVTEIRRYPSGKDATDLELSMDLAVEKGATYISLLGALGGRWDMSIANIMLAAAADYRNIRVTLFNRECEMMILHPDRDYVLIGTPGETISLLPLQGDVHGVTLVGFEYPLHDHTLHFGSSRGVSNVLRAAEATLRHTEGVLLCVRHVLV